ncbi:MAG: F-type H+-transporting ATPase subunit b [Bacteroidota bacterium]|nr:F-type H+-transporting ATPase subunit b [Bacteroidota bacterium]
MDSLMNVSPGAIIWTLINFSIFLFLLIKFGAKPIASGLKAREDRINTAIKNAEDANLKAAELLRESQAKLDQTQQEINSMFTKNKEQAESLVRKAAEEAEKVKHLKIQEAVREIERSKDTAIFELRKEVAGLVILATEKLLDEKLDREKHHKLIESYIEKLPNN